MGRRVGGTMGKIARHARAGHGQRGRPATRETNMKVVKGRFSGTIGNEVYVNSKYGQVVRSRPRRPSRPTPARLRARRDLSRVASAGRPGRARQLEAWTIAAMRWSLTAYAFFCKINLALAAASLPLVMNPP